MASLPGFRFVPQDVEAEREMQVEIRGEPGDFGSEGRALAEEAGDDVVALAWEVADVAAVEVDSHGVFVVGVEGLSDEFERVAGFEDGQRGGIGVVPGAAQRRGVETVGAGWNGQWIVGEVGEGDHGGGASEAG